jgi:DNA helicase-2/ATP-dependent DNA helicase PcrA
MTHKDTSAAFKEAYDSLNAAQKEAVDTIEGPVMVIAGPGTGKTQILTLRIAKILLETQMDPSNILALTFTDAGVKAMRERLHRYIGAAAYQVAIYTFHGFAERLIREYPDAYERVIGGRPASDLDKVSIVETILDDTQFKLLRPMGDPGYYIFHIIRTISSLKKEYITPDAFAQVIAQQEQDLLGIEKIHEKGAHKGKVRGEYTKKEKAIEKNRELLLAYRQYETLLSDKRLYDFEDMIVETVKALESNEDMLRDLQETYQYVLADEHQDVNGSQNRILELLCNFHDQPNIFVVGDEKQAIYRFQGASLENFLYFEDLFKNTKRISLTENYRSGQVILDAAHSLVKVEEGPLSLLRVPLLAKAVKISSVERRDFSHQAIEDSWVIDEVVKLIEGGMEPEEIAVIVRTNREVEQFAGLLRKEGIAAEASADGDVLDHPITHTVLGLIEAVVSSHNQLALFSLIHGAYWGIGTNDLIKIASARSYGNSLQSILSDRAKLEELGVEHIQEAMNVVATLEEARRMEATQAPHRVLEFLLQKSGFIDHVLQQDTLEGSRVIRRLYDEVEEMVLHDKTATLRGVNDVFSLRRGHRLPLNAPYIATSTQAVQIMTAHKSKGLEFKAVFIPHAVDNIWGGGAKRTYFDIPLTKHLDESQFDEIDDERRLLYVAMTRAKGRLYLSHAELNAEAKELISSRLLEDIGEEFIEHIETNQKEASFDPLSSIKKSAPSAAIDSELFKTHLGSKGLSATALNNYLRSPWDYVYRNVLRVPEVQALPMQFGTAIHGVMEWVSAVYASKGVMPSATQLKESLEKELSRLPITQTEFVRLHEKGFEALVGYTGHIASSMPKDSKVEFSVHVALPTGLLDFPEVTLTGKIDRLDFDKNGNVTQVVDYKTGKPKTRNEIEGKTQNSNGDYKRQLTFYALLLSLYDDAKYACKTGKLSFIEPDAKGVVHEEVFEITDDEIAELKGEIIRVVQEIVTGSFLSTECNEKDSNYCHLVRMLQEGK